MALGRSVPNQISHARDQKWLIDNPIYAKRDWPAENARLFRHGLLSCCDGARLHAGTTPNTDEICRVAVKVDYLVRAGIPQQEAAMTLYSLGQFTLGCVLEEQAYRSRIDVEPGNIQVAATLSGPSLHLIAAVEKPGSEMAFEFGLSPIIAGLVRKVQDRSSSRNPSTVDKPSPAKSPLIQEYERTLGPQLSISGQCTR